MRSPNAHIWRWLRQRPRTALEPVIYHRAADDAEPVGYRRPADTEAVEGDDDTDTKADS